MNYARNYIERIRALIVSNAEVVIWAIAREEAQGDKGLFRYRLTLQDSSFLEIF